jgi:hypothetical protein
LAGSLIQDTLPSDAYLLVADAEHFLSAPLYLPDLFRRLVEGNAQQRVQDRYILSVLNVIFSKLTVANRAAKSMS